jgi:hypothetical protein
MGNIYRMFDLGTKLNCQASQKPGFVFSSWSGGIGSNLGDISTPITNYSSRTANFVVAPANLTIPPELLYGVILGPVVGAIIGWFIPFTLDRMEKKHEPTKS